LRLKYYLDEKVSSPGAAIAGLFFDHEKNTLVTVDEMDESCRQVTNVYKILVGKLEGKIRLGRPMRRWTDNIRLDLRKIGWEDVDWIHLA